MIILGCLQRQPETMSPLQASTMLYSFFIVVVGIPSIWHIVGAHSAYIYMHYINE